jgi:hypothetical protein
VEGPRKVEDKDKDKAAAIEELQGKLDEVETTVMPKVPRNPKTRTKNSRPNNLKPKP